MTKSFQSENVLDTLEEQMVEEKDYGEFKELSKSNINIDHDLDNSLSKSQLTMEDNNKA